MEHYFISNKFNKDQVFKFDADILGDRFVFNSHPGVFNYKNIDYGTLVLLKTIEKLNINPSGDVLDIGCGLGVIGIVVAKKYSTYVTMCDVNETSVTLANMNIKENNVHATVCVSDCYSAINSKFDYIITNPPIKAGKKVLFDIVLGAYEHLNNGGQIILVIKKNLGMDSLKKAMTDKFGNCEILNRDKGYYILSSTLTK